LVVTQVADSPLDGYSVVMALADSAVAPDDCSAVPRAADSLLGGCSVAPVKADSAALMADDSAARDWLRPDAHLDSADSQDGSPVG
jgi:hypothetical protein